MTAAANAGDWLYLFSSNRSPLYEQDILNVLAAPAGLHYTFRYDPKYVEPQTEEKWETLAGQRVLVLFSIQQEAQYHAAAFLPVRMGDVVSADRVGTRLFVTFRLAGRVALPDPKDGDKLVYDKRVQTFTESLDELVMTPHDASAALGKPLTLDTEPTDIELFERSADYLSRTDSFRRARFVAFLSLRKAGSADDLLLSGEPPTYEIDAGATYDLRLVHAQRIAPTPPEPFLIATDEAAVGVIGRAGFDIASRYDRITLPLHAAPISTLEPRQTVVVIEPEPGVQGPRLELPLRIKPNKRRLTISTLGQSLALALVALPAVFPEWSQGLRLTLALVGVLAGATLGLFGIQALKAPSLSGTKASTPPPAEKPAEPAKA